MENKTLTARDVRVGRFLLRVLLVAIPVLTLFFWGLGGGNNRAWGKAIEGFNMRMPVARVPSVAKMNKMDYYALAARDSVAERQKARMEKSYAKTLGIDSAQEPEAMVAKVRAKLENVKKLLSQAPVPVARPMAERALET